MERFDFDLGDGGDGFFEGLRPRFHLIEPCTRRAFDADHKLPGIVDRLKFRPQKREQQEIEEQCGKSKRHHLFRAANRVGHKVAVGGAHRFKSPLEAVQEPRHEAGTKGGRSAGRFEPIGRNHGGERVGGEGGKRQREGHRKAELLKILPHRFPHAADGDEHRQEGHGRGQDGEQEFLRGVRRCDGGRFPHFHVAEDIFHQDDGVVDEKAHGQRKPHEGHVVQGKAHRLHQKEGGDDGGGDGETADEGRSQIAEEKVGDGKRQKAAKEDGVPDVADVLPDVLGLLGDGIAHDVRGQIVPQDAVKAFIHRIHHRHGIRAGLLSHPHQHRGRAVRAGIGLLLLPAVADGGDVGEEDGLSPVAFHHEGLKIVYGSEFPDRANGDGIRVVTNLAAGGVLIGAVDFFDHRLEGNAVRS